MDEGAAWPHRPFSIEGLLQQKAPYLIQSSELLRSGERDPRRGFFFFFYVEFHKHQKGALQVQTL
jgi:hypothetical protein